MNEKLDLYKHIYKDCEMSIFTLTKLLEELKEKDNKIKKDVEEILKGYERYKDKQISLNTVQKELRENIEYYMTNTKIIIEGLQKVGFKTFGGDNAPYVWLKIPNNMKSWDFFDILLNDVVGTPGVGFGPSGEGYFRLTSFGTYEATKEAMERFDAVL